MTHDEIEDRLRKRFLGKDCRIPHHLGGTEASLDVDGTPIETVIADGQTFRRVIDIKVTAPDSAWYWFARFTFSDGSISGSFDKIGDVLVRGENDE